ncbi:MAG: zinc ribbon domain-containing protein [Fidelibacterota bacterium]
MRLRTTLAVLLLASLVRPEDSSPFEDLIVAIWPEYDHPGVLVIYTGTIKDDHLPLHLEARVPDETNIALAVGQSDTSDKLLPVDIEERDGGKWIFTTLVKESFQIEFYYNPFGPSELRQADLTIEMNHSVDTYHIAIQQPLAAEQFQFSETNADKFTDEHGLTYYRVHRGSLPSGERASISYSYLNRKGKLSVLLLQERLGSGPGATLPQASAVQAGPSRYRLPTYQPLAILGVLAVVIGLLFVSSNKNRPKEAAPKRGRNFCTNCGGKIDQAGKFCSHCGKKLP